MKVDYEYNKLSAAVAYWGDEEINTILKRWYIYIKHIEQQEENLKNIEKEIIC